MLEHRFRSVGAANVGLVLPVVVVEGVARLCAAAHFNPGANLSWPQTLNPPSTGPAFTAKATQAPAYFAAQEDAYLQPGSGGLFLTPYKTGNGSASDPALSVQV